MTALNLKLITNHSNKLGSASTQSKAEGLAVWTILSSSKIAKKYNGPQENLPQERLDTLSVTLVTCQGNNDKRLQCRS